MPDDTEITEETKRKAKNRLHGLIIDEVSGVAAGANKETEWLIMKTDEEPESADNAEWSTDYVNDLPDSSFFFIAPGGKKDNEGKTTPRSLRKLPYKDENGKVDIPHLRNAIARVPQTDGLSQEEKDRLQERARGILEEHTKEDAKKSADTGAGEHDMANSTPVKIEKMDEKLDRARDILWGAMDKLKERLYPADEVAQSAVLDAVVAAVGGEDTEILMSADDEGVAKAQDSIAEALAKVVEESPIAKSALAIGPRPAPEPVAKNAQDGHPNEETAPIDIEKAGKKQMSNKRARKFRDAMSAMVKLLHEMDPSLEKEALWPVPAAKSAEDTEKEAAPKKSDVEKKNEQLEAEVLKLRADVAKANRRPVPSNVQIDEKPAAPVAKTAPSLNYMNLNEGL